MDSRHVPMEELEVFKRFVSVADRTWDVVFKWEPFVRDTVGKQLVRDIDSIGANLVEGDGRYSDAEAVHFFRIARGSAREARYWLQRAVQRRIITETEGQDSIEQLRSATQLLNRLIAYRRQGVSKTDKVKEERAAYRPRIYDPFTLIDELETVEAPERPNA